MSFVADFGLDVARKHVKDLNIIYALEAYFKYFETTNFSEIDTGNEQEFVCFLNDMAPELENVLGLENVIQFYLRAIEIFSHNKDLLNTFGAILFRNGERDMGESFIKQALNLDPEFLPALKNLTHIKWHLMPRWHFRMLNGVIRNRAYYEAIQKAINCGFRNIIDIGSGCGLLTFYAASHSAQPKVIGFESNPTLFDISQKVLLEEFKLTNANIINANSNDISKLSGIPKNLLITEIFDVSLFGEGALKSIKHALDNFMDQEKVIKVIPAKASIYLVGINSERILKKSKFLNKIPEIALENINIYSQDEPYEAEHLHKNDKVLTNTEHILTVEFNNLQQLSNLYEDKFKKDISLQVTEKGQLNALMCYFKLFVDDDIVISTDPFNKNREKCWEQAIFRIKHPMNVEKNKLVQVKTKLINEKFIFEIANGQNTLLNEVSFSVSTNLLEFLNDKVWINTLLKLAENSLLAKNTIVIDFCTFPLVGFLFAKRGHTVYHFYQDAKNLPLFEHLVKINNIHSIMHFNAYVDYLPFIKHLKNKYFVLYEPTLQDGSLNISPLDRVCISNNGLLQIEPRSISMEWMVISSEYLYDCNFVTDDNIKPFRVSKHINQYSGNEHPDLDDFPYTALSPTFEWNLSQDTKKDFKFCYKGKEEK